MEKFYFTCFKFKVLPKSKIIILRYVAYKVLLKTPVIITVSIKYSISHFNID